MVLKELLLDDRLEGSLNNLLSGILSVGLKI